VEKSGMTERAIVGVRNIGIGSQLLAFTVTKRGVVIAGVSHGMV
jgi:hypothetical protein